MGSTSSSNSKERDATEAMLRQQVAASEQKNAALQEELRLAAERAAADQLALRIAAERAAADKASAKWFPLAHNVSFQNDGNFNPFSDSHRRVTVRLSFF
jgi:hypothetical protein